MRTLVNLAWRNMWRNWRRTGIALIAIVLVMAGVFAVVVTPREEEPQIVVPMIDVMVMLPGATPEEVENIVTRPMEQKIWEIEGVEYVYSSSFPSFAITI